MTPFVVAPYLPFSVSRDRKESIGSKVCERIATIVEDNKREGKITTLAVSGSSQPKILAPWFLEAPIDWDSVDFYFSDERVVSLDDPDSNFAAWNTHFFVRVESAFCVHS